MSVVKIVDEDCQVGECADTWYEQIQPTETVELYLPGNLPMRLQCDESKIIDELTVLQLTTVL